MGQGVSGREDGKGVEKGVRSGGRGKESLKGRGKGGWKE